MAADRQGWSGDAVKAGIQAGVQTLSSPPAVLLTVFGAPVIVESQYRTVVSSQVHFS